MKGRALSRRGTLAAFAGALGSMGAGELRRAIGRARGDQ
jgi:hypothetical protein